ncbi:predicted protein [Naegleria gruberi]|uniref:Predicted protein n=1 Tax=Naegleria gruberi TaxID=5762 RepID=D2VVV2_NAEGR|nr:uncharacterized protein NAEGRDRAFT_73151 [Naegleria gruberi]EFC39168.1 predicted protein [Naegleria gruberi]|eukprot:XP_002671912.1 predicted protein [Naegleria gruberi strain NEG-M]
MRPLNHQDNSEPTNNNTKQTFEMNSNNQSYSATNSGSSMNFLSNLGNDNTSSGNNGGFLSSLGKSLGNSASGWETVQDPSISSVNNQQPAMNPVNQQLMMNNHNPSLQQILMQQQLLGGMNPNSFGLLFQQRQQEYLNFVNNNRGFIPNQNINLSTNVINGQSSSSSSNGSEGNEKTGSPNQTAATDDNTEFFPIACEPCRKQHRKCDKKLPCCTACTQRSVECIYRESKRNAIKGTEEKKKRKKKKGVTSFKPKDGVVSNDPKFKPYHSTTNNNIAEKNSDSDSDNVEEVGHLSKRNVIDFYFDIACDGCPLVSKEELENYITTPNDIEGEKSNKKEMFPLFLSVRALCECRYGLAELAEKTAQRAKKALSKMFDQIQSYHIAATYGNLASYEGWVGRYENAKFYMQILQYYVKTQLSGEEKRATMTDCERNLENLVFYFNNVLGDDLNRLDLKEFLRRLPDIYSFFTMDKFPEEWIGVVTREVNSENCFEIWSVVQMCVENIKKVAKGLIDTPTKSPALACFSYGPEYEELVDPIFTLIANSLRISILSKSHNPTVRDIMEKAALEITEITQHAWFPLFPIETLVCVAKATNVHLQIVKTLISSQSTDFRYNGIDYFDILEKDMRAFNLMKKRYKFVELFFKDLLADMEQYLSLIRVRRVVSVQPTPIDIPLNTQLNIEVTPTQPEDYSSVGITGFENPLFWESSSFLSEQDLSGIFTREFE